MSDPLTPDQLQEIRALLAKATPRPWTAERHGRGINGPRCDNKRNSPLREVISLDYGECLCDRPCCSQPTYLAISDSDRALIVTLVNLAPQLLAERDALTRERDELKAECVNAEYDSDATIRRLLDELRALQCDLTAATRERDYYQTRVEMLEAEANPDDVMRINAELQERDRLRAQVSGTAPPE